MAHEAPTTDKRKLFDERNQLVEAGRRVNELADAEKRSLNADEAQQLDRMEARIEELDAQLNEIERREKWDRLQSRTNESRGRQTRSSDFGPITQADKAAADAERRSRAFLAHLAGRTDELGPEERRDLGLGTITGGGVFAPMSFSNQVIVAVDELLPIHQLVTKVPVPPGSSGVGVPTLDADPSDPEWTNELTVPTADTTMAFGMRALGLHDLRKKIKVSLNMLELTNAEPLIANRLGRKFAVAYENNILNGNGAGKPLGIFTKDVNGAIPTTRDVAFASATTVAADTLIEAQESLGQAYWARAAWVWHPQGLRRIRQLKDGQGRYLWETGNLTLGPNGQLLGMPIIRSSYCPSTFTAGLYVGAIVDWSCYWWSYAGDLRIQRLNELHADSGQVGFNAYARADGQMADPSGIVRLRMA